MLLFYKKIYTVLDKTSSKLSNRNKTEEARA